MKKDAENKNKQNKKHYTGRKIALLIIGVCVIFAGALIGLLLGVAVGCVITTKTLTMDDLVSTGKTTVIYDSDGEIIETLSSEQASNTVYVGIDEIPEDLQHAFVAIEDERFYTHNGVDIKRTASAVVGFFIPGMSSHGGSTITQQLVKNVTGDDSRSVPRKIREQWRAIQLEKLVDDKDKILELYLNKIYFANNCYGVETAARKYFGKTVSQLSLAECSFLAGITNNPAKFNPATTAGRQNAYKRQITILDNMMAQGYVTKEEYIEAIQTDLVFAIDQPSEEVKENHVYSYFVDSVIKYVRNDLMEQYGYTKTQANNIIYNQGIKIYTTQDSRIQGIVDEVFTNDAYYRVNGQRDPEDCAQSAIAVMDQHTGDVVAIYGGYGEKTQSLTYNRATDIQRQPGSTIKPLLVYGPLVDRKVITIGDAMDELAVALDDQNPDKIWPSNWDNKVHGFLNFRYALGLSYNIPAATCFKDNMNTCIAYMKKCGIDKSDEPYLSSALGGFKNGVSPLQMCGGYSMIANGGVYNTPVFYTKVYSDSGELLLNNTTKENATLIYEHQETASIMTSMLVSVVWDPRSTGNVAQIYINDEKLPLAGKTGSTNDLKDYWFCGFTDYYTAAVWYGYDNGTSISERDEGGSAMILWKAVMTKIHETLPIREFTMHKDLVKVEICACSGKRATAACREDSCSQHGVYTEYFIKGTEPAANDTCKVHKYVTVCTECRDRFGKYCLATSKCIENGTVKQIAGTVRSDDTYDYILETLRLSDQYLPTDWSYEVSHEYCKTCGGVPPWEEEPEEEPIFDPLDPYYTPVIPPEDEQTDQTEAGGDQLDN